MSEQDTSEEVQVASKQPTNTGHNSSEQAASSNKWDGKSILLTLLGGLLPAGSLVMYFYTGAERNDPKIHWLPISIMLIIIFLIILFLWKKLWIFKNISQFNSWIFGATLIGGTIAFLLPLGIANNFTKDGEGTALRQMLIYTTGGLLGVITLSETRRKNDLEKDKNEQDHIRQVHAERRSRYTKAVEQLADDNAAIRLGGVYTLFGLADEWLADNLIDKSTQVEESQTIVNNLCAYIRTPLSAEEKEKILEYSSPDNLYLTKKINFPEILKEEQGIRRTIMKEIKERTIIYSPIKRRTNWSNFYFDFSDSTFFYEIDFSMCKFNNRILFSNSLFAKESMFTGTEFLGSADFSNSTFKSVAMFIAASQKGFGDFTFEEAKFHMGAAFTGSEIEGRADFRGAEFNLDADFRESIFHESTFFSRTSFNKGVNFSGAAFCENTFFFDATFGNSKGLTSFLPEINFSNTTFIEEADFSWAKFYYPTNFSSASFYDSDPIFKKASFLGSTKNLPTIFQGPIEYVFSASHSSPFYITTEHHLSPHGDSHFIPTGADIFIIENKKPTKKEKTKKKKNKNK